MRGRLGRERNDTGAPPEEEERLTTTKHLTAKYGAATPLRALRAAAAAGYNPDAAATHRPSSHSTRSASSKTSSRATTSTTRPPSARSTALQNVVNRLTAAADGAHRPPLHHPPLARFRYPEQRRQDRPTHPADTSRSNLATALALLSRWRLSKLQLTARRHTPSCARR
jgi:hypothetical protein